MPPWALHQATIALTASPISWSRPGLPEKPRSSPYAMLIVVLVTPWSVAPVAWPLPHGEGSVPNSWWSRTTKHADAAGATTTPAVVNIASTSPNPSVRLPRNLIMAQPPVRGTGRHGDSGTGP